MALNETPLNFKEIIMPKFTSPVKAIHTVLTNRAYNRMIKASQAKLAETTPVSYSKVTA